jgi:phosphoglycolate phosphatase-like HAD superfamily hydrolase
MPICFDLDGTLGSFGGGYVLLRQALGELWGMDPSPEELHACAGSTDWEIVEELHRARFGRPLEEDQYHSYQEGCLRRFVAAFPPAPPAHAVFPGLVGSVAGLMAQGRPAAVVSGNAPRVLDFKLSRLGLGPALPRIGSLPGKDRAALLAHGLEGCPGPHLYVGDRPHDLEAANKTGIPFLGVGERVPDADVSVSQDATTEEVLHWIGRLTAATAPRSYPERSSPLDRRNS